MEPPLGTLRIRTPDMTEIPPIPAFPSTGAEPAEAGSAGPAEASLPPVLFAFGLHAHQPVGNFDHVFWEHLRDVYEPFLQRAREGGLLPFTLHLSGPLLDWLENHAPSYLDQVGELAGAGQVELLLAGYDEPILPALCREDRLEQVLRMREALRARFGVDARGLWLTERVWEPDLAGDLAEAGVEYVLVDDRHFVAAGFQREELHLPFWTEACGRGLGVFAIDERLRYLIPFHPPEHTAGYLRELRRQGKRLAVAADDIEKFGGWPGTREWVYDRGWLGHFLETLKGMEEAGEVRLVTLGRALAELPKGGLAYLPSASYREMEEWALPAPAFRRLGELKALVGEERLARGESPLIRGSHWRNFLVKYSEANRMHKKMLALSGICRRRGDPPAARRALGKAQCNDAYWHGVFGGLYLRHLRDAVWSHLAEAEGILREGESLGWEEVDLDLDGNPEIWVHSHAFSALVSPVRGGGVEELTLFSRRVNLANVLTRRREPYHQLNGGEAGEGARAGHGEAGNGNGGTPSIHDLEETLRFSALPPVDREDRALFQERIVAGKEALDRSPADGEAKVLWNWAREPLVLSHANLLPEGRLVLTFRTSRGPFLEKILVFSPDGRIHATFRWDPGGFPSGALFTSELSLAAEADLLLGGGPWVARFPLATFSKSERGFDETVQGESVVVAWPVEAGRGGVGLFPPC